VNLSFYDVFAQFYEHGTSFKGIILTLVS
jgi:hypothetical protein